MESKPPVRYRKLRIAWSVGCGILCSLLIVLWVRSYWRYDAITGPSSRFKAESVVGRLAYFVYTEGNEGWRMRSYSVEAFDAEPTKLGRKFAVMKERDVVGIFAPHWFLVLVTASLIFAPRLRYNFSIRTLLIAMMLVAIVLGLIAVSN